MNRRLRWAGCLSAGLLALLHIHGQEKASGLWAEIYRSAWVGSYTADQAARGESAYRERCSSCHGAALEGSDQAPPLTGPDFTDEWDQTTLADLFEKIKYTMPANRPGRLSEQQNADILSYILKCNRFPTGSLPLPPIADELRGVRFVAHDPGE